MRRRYMFDIYAAGVVSRDKVGRMCSSDGLAVAYGQRIVDELSRNDDYRDAIIDVSTSSGRLVARLISHEALLLDDPQQPAPQLPLH
ncbi:hypothetical protein IB267_18645 [Ensifer sp. ENS09]|uniref:DUF6894 family protein n=1 Tax=Ensifer sp. ENS09 TaxID=2769263 RepID=UPI00177D2606|nr:hypothetical protein [Ensifer sp. ENS09]MBD9650361.1 hypothetical protein [Ensifer sp. ENS09]